MHDAACVRGRDAVAHCHQHLQRLARRWACAVHARAQRLAFEQLGDRVMNAVLRAEIEDGQDVWMRQRGHRARLAIETVERRAVALEMRRQDLDRYIAVQSRILGAVNLAHPANGDELEDRVAS